MAYSNDSTGSMDFPMISPQPCALFRPRPQHMNMNKTIPVNQSGSLPPMSQQCVPIPIKALWSMLFREIKESIKRTRKGLGKNREINLTESGMEQSSGTRSYG